MRIMFLLAGLAFATASARADDWEMLFNGRDLTGWKANRQPASFGVKDGVIVVHPVDESAHLFYVGDGKDGSATLKNFELELTARCDGRANSGVYFHTAIDSGKGPKNHLGKGYEVQLNNTEKEKKKTGSLYAVKDLDASPVDETKWFTVRIVVKEKRITISVDGEQVVDYTEPEDVKREAARAGRVLDPNGGAIALQAHDPTSNYYFKDIRIKRLP